MVSAHLPCCTRRSAAFVRRVFRRFPGGRAVARSARIRYHLCVFIVNFQISGQTTMPIPQVFPPRFRIAFTRRRSCVSDPCVGFDP
jgi:hypothetical protein